jgi:asparaginyl-tRNA synthetase
MSTSTVIDESAHAASGGGGSDPSISVGAIQDGVVPGMRFLGVTEAPSTWARRRLRVVDVLAGGGESKIGQIITVGGWARNSRVQGGGDILFVSVTDGSCTKDLQVVCFSEKGAGPTTEGFSDATNAGRVGWSMRVTGTIMKSPANGQLIELHAKKIIVFGPIQGKMEDYPLSAKRLTPEKLREHLHLRPRSNLFGAVTRVRNACAFATHKFFAERGFLYIHTPIITTSDCEGAGEMFGVTTMLPESGKHDDVPRTEEGDIDYSKDFFKAQASLTVSGQLQVESFAVSMSDVYTFGPTFRAEKSHTNRHLSEFWMIEPEIAFANLSDDMALAEDYLKYCTQFVLDNCGADLAFFDERVEKDLIERLKLVVSTPFHRMTYTDAIELLTKPETLEKAEFDVVPHWGIDLGSEHERYLTDVVFKKPVIVTDYPKGIKAFYMRMNDDNKTVAAMDILVPRIGEVIGGSAREERMDVLKARMEEMGIPQEELQWYLDLRRFGSVPHAGFGLGFERLVMYLTGVQNIRDVIPYPRAPGKLSA